MRPIFTKAESMGATPFLLSDLEEPDLLVSRQLYYMLVMLTQSPLAPTQLGCAIVRKV